MINRQFRVLIGDNNDGDFWNDNWTGGNPRWVCFPIIFPLVRYKASLVVNFGKWDGGR